MIKFCNASSHGKGSPKEQDIYDVTLQQSDHIQYCTMTLLPVPTGRYFRGQIHLGTSVTMQMASHSMKASNTAVVWKLYDFQPASHCISEKVRDIATMVCHSKIVSSFVPHRF